MNSRERMKQQNVKGPELCKVYLLERSRQCTQCCDSNSNRTVNCDRLVSMQGDVTDDPVATPASDVAGDIDT